MATPKAGNFVPSAFIFMCRLMSVTNMSSTTRCPVLSIRIRSEALLTADSIIGSLVESSDEVKVSIEVFRHTGGSDGREVVACAQPRLALVRHG